MWACKSLNEQYAAETHLGSSFGAEKIEMQIVTPRYLDRHAAELESEGVDRFGSLDVVNWESILNDFLRFDQHTS